MTENQEREGDGQRGLQGKSIVTFTPQTKTPTLPKRKQAVMPTWCMLHCLIWLSRIIIPTFCLPPFST